MKESWKSLFVDAQPLADLPEVRPRVVWVVSAGEDGRPLVFFSERWTQRVAQEASLDTASLPVPELFVYTSLSPHGHDRMMGNYAYDDGRTKLVTTSSAPLKISGTAHNYCVARRHFHFAESYEHQAIFGDWHAAILSVAVSDSQHQYNARLLYLELENCNAFDEIMSAGYFDVQAIVATREGLGMGGCGKSVLKHIYTERRIERARSHGFNPRWVVASGDTQRNFLESAGEWYPDVREVAPYIGEPDTPMTHHLNRLW